jgi:hypothetical protein
MQVQKYVCVTIMALKPNQLQVTTYQPNTNAIIDKAVTDMLRSFDLENEILLKETIKHT